MRTGRPHGPSIKPAEKQPRAALHVGATDQCPASRGTSAERIIALVIGDELSAVLGQFGADMPGGTDPPPSSASKDAIDASPSDFENVARLMSFCVTQTQCPHFGLLVGQRSIFASLGIVACLMPRRLTVGVALKNLVGQLRRQDRDDSLILTVDGGLARLSYVAVGTAREGADQFADAAMVAALNIMRVLCGSDWAPTEVLLPRTPPPDLAPFTHVFQSPVLFEANASALVFHASWLRRRIASEDVLRGFFADRLRKPNAVADVSFGDVVRRVLRTRVLGDDCSAETIARLFSMHRRTLNRRLHEEGLAFNTIVNDIRFEAARQLMANAGMTLGQVAAALSFSEPSAFTRAFRRWSGQTPTAWQARHRAT